MTENLTLAQIDRDGALAEAADRLGHTRADFFRKTALAGGIAGAGALLASASTAEAASGDTAILNYALTLEYLEAAFYTEAVASGALKGRTAAFARTVKAHEVAHVAALKGVLGKAAVAKPTFNFHGTTENQAKFQATAMALEDTGVAAYKGQAGMIKSDAVLKAALAIHTVEARHASWIRHIVGQPPAPGGFDQPKTMKEVLAIVKGTNFIWTSPTTSSHSAPGFAG